MQLDCISESNETVSHWRHDVIDDIDEIQIKK